MTPVPFEGLTPATSADHAGWVVEAMGDRVGVARIVPDGFEAYARIPHPLSDGQRWSEAAPAYLADGVEPYPYPFPGPVEDVEGDMGTKLVDVLVAALGQDALAVLARPAESLRTRDRAIAAPEC